MNETLIAVAVIAGVYVLLSCAEFLCKLFVSAPGAIYAEQQAVISELRTSAGKPKRSPANEHYFQEAREILGGVSAPAKRLLRHIWAHEKLPEAGHYKVPELDSWEVCKLLVGELANEPASRIVHKQIARTPHRTVWWEIVPAYREALGDLLHGDQE